MKKKNGWKQVVVVALVGLFILGFSGGILLTSSQTQTTSVNVAISSPVIPAGEKKYSSAEIHRFGETVLWPQIQELCLGHHPVPEIAENLSAMMVALRVVYGTEKLDCSFVDGEPSLGQEMVAMGACKNDRGEPKIEVRVLFYLKIYDYWKANFVDTADLKQRFENMVTIGFMHEGFHLGLGMETCGSATGEGVDIPIEQIVWSMTCEHAILPLAQAGSPLSESDALYLNAWLPSKGQSEEWRQFVADGYTGLKKS